jgi:hypothetical protein
MIGMLYKKITMATVLCACLLLGACKITIEVPEGGYVTSASGNYSCGEEITSASTHARPVHQLHGANTPSVGIQHEEVEFHCDVDVDDPSFNETFIAVAHEGYEFVEWKRGPRYFHGGSTSPEAPLATDWLPVNDALLDLLASETVFYLEPVFRAELPHDGDTDCSAFNGSFERIQSVIFEGYNCTNSACHGGGAAAGGLDLDPAVAYENLYRVLSTANLTEPMQRIYPGEQANSFLFQKLAAATNGSELASGGGQAMPVGGQALSQDHLEAMRLWIRGGAPETADVDDVATLLGCDTPTKPSANKIDPPPAPALGEGVQFVSGPWTVAPHSENEVCFATYYDLTQMPGYLPDWALTSCGDAEYVDYDGSCVAIKASTLTQDPQSHHSIIDAYVGDTSPLDSRWGSWQCSSGPHQGESCDPTKIGVPVEQGGADCGGSRHVCATEVKKSVACVGWGARDLAFRSVGMGGAQSPISEQVLKNGVYSVLPSRGVITWNSHAFNLSDKPTTVEQYNNFIFARQDERRYRSRGIFDTKDIFVADVPPFEKRTYCSTYTLPRGARLTQLSSHAHKRGVLWQTWLPPQDRSCKVEIGCKPNDTPPDYVSRIYNDPLYLDYDPPLEFDSFNAGERAIKFCVTYDNGADYPELLKRNSSSVGTTCHGRAYCVGGSSPGKFCGGDDSACGDGGVCDACRVTGGVTTEDEMFILLGSYYIVPESERN